MQKSSRNHLLFIILTIIILMTTKTWKFKTETEYYMEEAIRFLIQNMPREASEKKPVILHSIRVWTYLRNKWCSRDVIVGWFLHDLIEDSNLESHDIEIIFWKEVASIVIANSKNMNIESEKRLEESIKRCKEYWTDALLVKAADVIDNYYFYQNLENAWEMLRATDQWKILLDQIDSKIQSNHIVFNELQEIV